MDAEQKEVGRLEQADFHFIHFDLIIDQRGWVGQLPPRPNLVPRPKSWENSLSKDPEEREQNAEERKRGGDEEGRKKSEEEEREEESLEEWVEEEIKDNNYLSQRQRFSFIMILLELQKKNCYSFFIYLKNCDSDSNLIICLKKANLAQNTSRLS